MRWPILLGGGLGLVGACLALARLGNLVASPSAFLAVFAAAFACYGAMLWALGRLRGRRALLVVLIVAVLGRMTLLFASPTLSTDVYRYVWDARVASAGISPYVAAPSASELTHLRDGTVYPQLNHPTWRTIYPPGAQLLFRLVYAIAPDNVLAMKMMLGLAEVATLVVLASLLRALGVPPARLAVCALNPLVLVEVWGSGHLDAVVMLSAVAAVRLAVARHLNVAAAVLGVGTLVKLSPAALLPLLLLDGAVWGPLVTFAVVLVAGYAPFLNLGAGVLGSLPQYLSSEFHNPGLVRTVIDVPAVTVLALTAWVAVVALLRRDVSLVDRVFFVIAGVTVLSPNIFPWYVLWLVPFLAIRPSVPWVVFTGTVGLAYTFFLNDPWAIPAWARAAEFLPLVIGAGWTVARSIPRRASREAALVSRPVEGGQS